MTCDIFVSLIWVSPFTVFDIVRFTGGERERGRGKEKAEAGTLDGGGGTPSPLAAPLFELRVPAAPPSPLAAPLFEL